MHEQPTFAQRVRNVFAFLRQSIADWWQRLAGKRLAMYIGGLIALILFLIFIVWPAVVGYKAYRDISAENETVGTYSAKVSGLSADLDSTLQTLETCQADANRTAAELDKAKTRTADCAADADKRLSEAQSRTATLEKDLAAKEKELELTRAGAEASMQKQTELEKAVADAKARYETLARNLANNKCCKEKVDDKAIDSYEIMTDFINCLKGGELKISC